MAAVGLHRGMPQHHSGVTFFKVPYALGTRTALFLGPGCSGHHVLLEHERCYALGITLWSPNALGTRMHTNGVTPWTYAVVA